MHRKYVAFAPVLAVSLVLPLAACGSDDSGQSGGKIKGTGSGSAKSSPAQESASPSESSDSSGAPHFDFPKDVKVKIDADKTGDPAKDQILRDHKYAMLTRQELLAKGKRGENFGRYWTSQAGITYGKILHDYKKENLTVTGVDHFYDRKVESHTRKTAIVTFCEDQSKAFDKYQKTGKIKDRSTSAESFSAMRNVMTKSKYGDWQVSRRSGILGDPSCRKRA